MEDSESALLASLIGRQIIGWEPGGRSGIATIALRLDDGRIVGFTASPEYHSYDQDRCTVVIGVEKL